MTGEPSGDGAGSASQVAASSSTAPASPPVRRRTLLRFGIAGTVGAAGGGAAVYTFVANAAGPFLTKFAEQFALNRLDDGLTWLISQGYDKLAATFADGETAVAVQPKDEVYVTEDRRSVVVGVELLDKPTLAPGVMVVMRDSRRINLLPRAAQALSRTHSSLVEGSNYVSPMSVEEAIAHLYPEYVIRDGKEQGNPILTYQAARGSVTLMFNRATNNEEVHVASLGYRWMYRVMVDSPELA